MWRKCDLHRHAWPNEQNGDPFDPDAFLAAAAADELEVIAVTDHRSVARVSAILERAPEFGLDVIPGVEASTDRGEVVVLAPGPEGLECLREFGERVGFLAGSVDFNRLIDDYNGRRTDGSWFSEQVVLVGAHVDRPASLLGPQDQREVSDQVASAQGLQALEVVNLDTLKQWNSTSGVKQTGIQLALVRGSDSHGPDGYERRHTWLYLPDLGVRSFRHALATPESSIAVSDDRPEDVDAWVASIRFVGGLYAGRVVEFSPRVTALIGPPSSGKSLVIDALRSVIAEESGVSEVAQASRERIAHCLPTGCSVEVEVVVGSQRHTLTKQIGGAQSAVPPFRPVLFSQTELTRRAMEPKPAMALLDVHCPESEVLRQELRGYPTTILKALEELVEVAARSKPLRQEVDNPVDGLNAAKASFSRLFGDDAGAELVLGVNAVERWRSSLTEAVDEWRSQLQVPAPPFPMAAPVLPDPQKDLGATPRSEVLAAREEFAAKVTQAAEEYVAAVNAQLRETNPALERARALAEERSGRSLESASAASKEATRLRESIQRLEGTAGSLAALNRDIETRLTAIDSLIDRAAEAHTSLRRARRGACAQVSDSMSEFFVRLAEGRDTSQLDAALDAAKVGTNFQSDRLRTVRDSLDRKRFLRFFVAEMAGVSSTTQSDARSIATEAARRGSLGAVAQLLALWPRDSLQILRAMPGGPPVPFEELTEGLRALAIKEISFAASNLPVISDQPEDAVPTAAVFGTLVPTLRTQRRKRQFILASHDANVVVAGDVDRVVVLPGEPEGEQLAGTLFEGAVRTSAMDLLEGGAVAFERRRRRYGAV